MLCDRTPRCASVATNGLWRMAARAWHEPPAETYSVVSARPSHSRLIKFLISDFPLFYMRFPVGHSILIKTFIPWRMNHSLPASPLRISSPFRNVGNTATSMKPGQRKRCISRIWTVSRSPWVTLYSIANAFSKRFVPKPFATTASLPPSTLR